MYYLSCLFTCLLVIVSNCLLSYRTFPLRLLVQHVFNVQLSLVLSYVSSSRPSSRSFHFRFLSISRSVGNAFSSHEWLPFSWERLCVNAAAAAAAADARHKCVKGNSDRVAASRCHCTTINGDDFGPPNIIRGRASHLKTNFGHDEGKNVFAPLGIEIFRGLLQASLV